MCYLNYNNHVNSVRTKINKVSFEWKLCEKPVEEVEIVLKKNWIVFRLNKLENVDNNEWMRNDEWSLENNYVIFIIICDFDLICSFPEDGILQFWRAGDFRLRMSSLCYFSFCQNHFEQRKKAQHFDPNPIFLHHLPQSFPRLGRTRCPNGWWKERERRMCLPNGKVRSELLFYSTACI